MRKTGIEKSKTDKLQPWRVWYDGFLVWFARTEEEAKEKLKAAERRH